MRIKDRWKYNFPIENNLEKIWFTRKTNTSHN